MSKAVASQLTRGAFPANIYAQSPPTLRPRVLGRASGGSSPQVSFHFQTSRKTITSAVKSNTGDLSASRSFVGSNKQCRVTAAVGSGGQKRLRSSKVPRRALGSEYGTWSGGVPAPEDVSGPPAGAEVSGSGLASIVLERPAHPGERPCADDTVTVDYTGWTTDGQMFDSSLPGGDRATFMLKNVIEGWTEGLQLMTPGEKRRFWVPEGLAYRGLKGYPAGMLVFDIELHSFQTKPRPPKVPKDVHSIPLDAAVTSSGLASKVLKFGHGRRQPGPGASVTVDYTGWTTDGLMFDSSIPRGETITFPLDHVIQGWSEGLQMMVEGEQRRFWIPAELAYGHNPPRGAPGGMLVFEVELHAIDDPSFGEN